MKQKSKYELTLEPLIPTETGIYCHLLTLDDMKIVIDCGIGQNFDYSVYNEEIMEKYRIVMEC